jgi:hypothetical protein
VYFIGRGNFIYMISDAKLNSSCSPSLRYGTLLTAIRFIVPSFHHFFIRNVTIVLDDSFRGSSSGSCAGSRCSLGRFGGLRSGFGGGFGSGLSGSLKISVYDLRF